jgi:hypothetical protein
MRNDDFFCPHFFGFQVLLVIKLHKEREPRRSSSPILLGSDVRSFCSLLLWRGGACWLSPPLFFYSSTSSSLDEPCSSSCPSPSPFFFVFLLASRTFSALDLIISSSSFSLRRAEAFSSLAASSAAPFSSATAARSFCRSLSASSLIAASRRWEKEEDCSARDSRDLTVCSRRVATDRTCSSVGNGGGEGCRRRRRRLSLSSSLLRTRLLLLLLLLRLLRHLSSDESLPSSSCLPCPREGIRVERRRAADSKERNRKAMKSEKN